MILAVIAVLATGCSDDGPKERAAGKTTTTEPAPEPYTDYDDHRSEQYAGTSNWICHPDLAEDECGELDTTVVGADDERRVEKAEPAEDPGFDCFYVYPTTSTDPGINSDLDVDASEIDTVRSQVARYASVCRVFAPAYRQVTLAGLSKGGFSGQTLGLAYGDVLDAWKTYVNDFNEGRGVVLIGHSQGSGHLSRLLSEEVDPEPGLRSLLVSAVLLGTSVAEGQLKDIPTCTSAEQAGCLMSFSSYSAAMAPAEGALFGRGGKGKRAVCVNPAELAGDDGLADVVVPAKPSLVGGTPGLEGFTTPFISLPGALRAECTTKGNYTFLGFEQAVAADQRPVADLLEQRLGPSWGLHLLDANLAQDDLIEVVARQAEAHRR